MFLKRLAQKSEKKNFAPSGAWKIWYQMLALFAFVWIYTELCLHVLIFGGPGRNIIYPVLFGLAAAGGCTMLCVGLRPMAQRILGTVITVLVVLWAEVQYIYQAIFGSLMPLSSLGLGGNVANFRSQLLYSMGRNIPQILALLVPVLVWLLLLVLKRTLREKGTWRQVLAGLAVAFLAAAASVGIMYTGHNNPASAFRLFNSPDTGTTASYHSVGMVGTTLSEIRFMLFTPEEGSSLIPENREAVKVDPATENAQEIDFEALAASTDDRALKNLDSYLATVQPSGKNAYTGILKDFNVIYICAESFSPLMISPELTPTLYKMSNGGFVFKNFYGSFNSVTTNGEYTMCTGLFPDLSRKKVASSFDASIGHYLPYCLGNALGQLGYQTMAYHNYVGEFYNRNLTHANMGYEFISTSNGLEEVTVQWPASDMEMMQASVDDYINSDGPFHAYYMTFSGHYQYDWYNAMSAKHQDRVQGVDKSETAKAFIACNLEVEDALTYLLDRLEQAGKLDTTLIVLTNDHYPYGLQEEEYNDLAGEEIDTQFEKFHNAFICYTTALEEPVIVEDYCCTADILPTVMNLLGLDYDSRLLAGTDVLSNAPHVAVLETGSFLTEDFRYNADTGEIIPHRDGITVTSQMLDTWSALISQKFELSREILNNDYYAHVYSQKGLDQQITENKIFDDITEIFTQSSAAWVVERGFMDPVSETEFGAKDYISLGEALDGWYRIMGCPKTSPEFLPKGYAASRNDPARLATEPEDENAPTPVPFDENYPYYDAVCWGFETGMLRPTDRVTGHDEPLTYYDAGLQIYRICRMQGIEIDPTAIVSDENGQDYDRIAKAMEEYPELDQEDIIALIWCLDEHIINLSRDPVLQIKASDKMLPRGRMVTYFFRTCVYELDMN